ncbi:MAG: flagellar biosynthetic protein FliR [Alphaproteobacteria bacterium]
MLIEFVPAQVFAHILVFARIGSALMIMPGFGEAYIPANVRLLFALLTTLVLTGIVQAGLPPLPGNFPALVLLVTGEILIGLFIGTLARILMSALATAGTVISFLTGFASAMLFNPALGDQGALTSVFLMLLGVLLVLVTDTHHVMLMGLVDSYAVFRPGVAPLFGDMADAMARMVADSFRIGLQIASPFMVVMVLFFTAMGLMARLMPQMPVFFVGLPIQIILGLGVLSMVLGTAMGWFLGHFEDAFASLLRVR